MPRSVIRYSPCAVRLGLGYVRMYPACNSSSTRPWHSLPPGFTPMLTAAPRTSTYGAGCPKICLRMCFNIPRAFSRLCGCFYGRDPRSESRDDAPVLPVTLVGLLQLLSEGCDSFVLCGYERSGSRLRLVGVMYITGRVLVGVQYHPHPAVFVALVGDGVPRYALPDSVHRDAHDFGRLIRLTPCYRTYVPL